MKVFLLQKLYPDERVEILIDFALVLANINHRLGYGENAVNFGNFYPIACVYKDGVGFILDSYSSNGDPFYSDIANYELNIKTASDFLVASTGQVVSCEEKSGIKSEIIVANKVRDFCFVLSKNFLLVSRSITTQAIPSLET